MLGIRESVETYQRVRVDIDLDAAKNAGIACALFDTEGHYDDYETPWRFQNMEALRRTLITA